MCCDKVTLRYIFGLGEGWHERRVRFECRVYSQLYRVRNRKAKLRWNILRLYIRRKYLDARDDIQNVV